MSQTATQQTAPQAPETPSQNAPNIDSKAPNTAPLETKGNPSPEPQDPRLEALARKERALTRKMREFQTSMKNWEAEKAKIQAEAAIRLDSNSWKEKFLADPTSLGISYDQISERFLRQPSPEEQKNAEAKREIEALRQAQEELNKKLSQSQVDAYEQAKKQIAREVSGLVETNKDYELVKAQGAHDSVVALIEETYKEDGVLMTTEEALKEVEDYLTEQAMSLLKLEKLQAKLKPAQEVTPAEQQVAQAQPTSKPGRVKQTINITPSQTRQQQVQTTLTHAMSQASTRPQGTMTSYERAIAAFKGQLK